MLDIRPRVRMPQTASPGDLIEIRTMATHPMHTGFVEDASGQIVPRHIIERFTCHFNGELVLDLELSPAVAANPFIEFDARVGESGEFEFVWYDDTGEVFTETARIEVG